MSAKESDVCNMYIHVNPSPLPSSRFSRRIVGDDPSPQDFNLDGDYYLLYGLGDRGNSGAGQL